MANQTQLPCDGDGYCMVCKEKPSAAEIMSCKTCATPWHLSCLSETLTADASNWDCPDCSFVPNPNANPVIPAASRSDLVASIRAIEDDSSLSEQEKAKRRQELLTRGKAAGEEDKHNQILHLEGFNCSFCMQLPDRPVTTPCGHNFCLKCFQKWIGQGKRTCAICRHAIPAKMASNPRINSSLVMAIRMAKMSNDSYSGGQPKVYQFIHNQDKPDKAYTTDRAKKSGKANACSGKIFVTVPPDHFGPILAENDPERKQGVLVGETWVDRLECRQWGAHLPHVAGISGQSDYGAQSVALSGGYEDDEDHGEWFLYTGSGGRDLSGNKRTNKTQSFDQKFEKQNESLRVSCRKGYPVRVVRSHKEKRSSYAPETGVRYDGIYRIEKCWRKPGIQGFKVCRYLFVRCDNDPAPWTSDDHGDRPRPLPNIEELKRAADITERKGSPHWDYDRERSSWVWLKPPPESRKQAASRSLEDGKGTQKVRRHKQAKTVKERLLKEFGCLICHKVMVMPLTTPCAHNFCKSCLEGAFAGQTFVRQRICEGRRTLRAQKNIMKCPSCSVDISDFLRYPQVNRELMNLIDSLQRQSQEMEENVDPNEETNADGENAESNKEMNADAENAKSNEEMNADMEKEDLAEETLDAEGINVLNEEKNVSDKKPDCIATENEICDTNNETLKEDEIKKESPAKSPTKPQTKEHYKRKRSDDNGNTKSEVTVHICNTGNGNLGPGDVLETLVGSNIQASPASRKTKKSNLQNKGDPVSSSYPSVGVQTRSRKKKLAEHASE